MTLLEELHAANAPLLSDWAQIAGCKEFETARAILAYWAATKRLTPGGSPAQAVVDLNLFVAANRAELIYHVVKEELLAYGYFRTWDEEVAAIARRYKEIDPDVPDPDVLRAIERLDTAALAAWACLSLGVMPKIAGLQEAGETVFDNAHYFLSAGRHCLRIVTETGGKVIDSLLAKTLSFHTVIATFYQYWAWKLDKAEALADIMAACVR